MGIIPEQIVAGVLRRQHTALIALRSPGRRRYAGQWSLPGGHVEPGETNQRTLVRELAEELGIKVLESAFLHTAELVNPDGSPVFFHIFSVAAWAGEPALYNDEHTRLRWIATDDTSALSSIRPAVFGDVIGGLAGT